MTDKIDYSNIEKLALISVSDKTGLEDLGRSLVDRGYHILASGGTAKKLREDAEISPNVIEVSDYTGFPESPDGLVKTLQGKVHAGLLMDPNKPEHARYMLEIGALPINFVAVNLYPFANAFAEYLEGNSEFEDVVNNVDIGGPGMLRSATKGMLLNRRPIVVCDPSQYELALDALDELDENGECDDVLCTLFAYHIFKHTSEYESNIYEFIKGRAEDLPFPKLLGSSEADEESSRRIEQMALPTKGGPHVKDLEDRDEC